MIKKRPSLELPWWSTDYDSVLPLQRAQVQILAGELRSCMLLGLAKKSHSQY